MFKAFEEQNKLIEKLEEKLETLSEVVKKKEIKGFEIDPKDIRGKKGDKGDKGDFVKGEDYVLTAKDKKEIASSIKVPVVEKIVEKTEVIKEQPIEKITNEIKEVAKYEKPEELAKKLNTLEEKVDLSVIRGLKNVLDILRRNIHSKQSGGGGMGLPVSFSFNGNGSTTEFTLPNNVAAGGNAIWVYYQGQYLVPATHFTVSGMTLSLTFTPDDGANIDGLLIRT